MKRLPRTLSPVEIRVLGALLEKEQATPAYYPLTVNALLQACNQKTNRSPVMTLGSTEVEATLDRLFEEDVFAWRSRAGRTIKWKQNVDRRWRLQPSTKAAITLLMLRGPQTVGELRLRCERLHSFEDLAAVERALASLAEGEDPLVRELQRQPGQKENRWTHLLEGKGASTPEAPRPATAQANTATPPKPPPSRPGAGDPAGDRLALLERRVAALEELLTDLGHELPGDLS